MFLATELDDPKVPTYLRTTWSKRNQREPSANIGRRPFMLKISKKDIRWQKRRAIQ